MAWAFWGLVWLAVAGALVRGGWPGPALGPTPDGINEVPASLWTGLQLEWAQVRAIVPRGVLGQDPMFWRDATHPRLALLAGLLGLVGWTYLVARVATRCFSSAVVWRRVGQAPGLRETAVRYANVVDWFGNVVAWFVIAGLAAALLHVCALTFHAGPARDAFLVLGAAAAFVQWASVLAVAVLAGLWAFDRARPWT